MRVKASDSIGRQLSSTDGRSSRRLYWGAQGVFVLVLVVIGVFGAQLTEAANLLLGLLLSVLGLPLVIVQVRRWHDRDKSGWWVLINLVPFIGAVWTLVECGFLPGTQGANRFGPDPKTIHGASTESASGMHERTKGRVPHTSAPSILDTPKRVAATPVRGTETLRRSAGESRASAPAARNVAKSDKQEMHWTETFALASIMVFVVGLFWFASAYAR
jgi:uncharacterized membrane protein YhaH (DUF805 family)